MTARGWLLGSVACVLVAGACTGARETGPAWPTLHAREADGGESLAPRPKTQTAAAVASSEDKTPAAVAEVPAAAAVVPVVPAVTPTVTAPEEVITTEDIVIEVDE